MYRCQVKMIYDGKDGDIINQYVTFTKVCSEQVKLHGRTQKAVLETIRICRDRNVLREYLESREKEVVDIMMVLYDEEEIAVASGLTIDEVEKLADSLQTVK